MKTRPDSKSARTTRALALGASVLAAAAMAAGPAAAEPASFTLTTASPRHTIQYSQAKRIAVCLPGRIRTTAATLNDGLIGAIMPLSVSWQGATQIVRPGACLHLDADRITLAPARAMPPGFALMGRVRAIDG